MPLRCLVTRMRTAAAAALRLPLGPRVSPAAGSRAFAASSSSPQVVGCRGTVFVSSRRSHDAQYQIHQDGASRAEEKHDPFELVADELSLLANRLRSMVAAEVPKLASAAEYFFKVGAEGNRFQPTVLLLMASALKFPMSESAGGVFSILANKLSTRQQNIAEIAEIIHVASLLHDDVLDDADTRRGVTSLNCIMGNKLSVLAGDFFLSRACVALAALGNTEVVSLMATAVEHLVTGETMQISTSRDQRRSMEYYCHVGPCIWPAQPGGGAAGPSSRLGIPCIALGSYN